MLKGECGHSLVAGTGAAADQYFYTLLDNKQKWLASEYDWPFLKQRADVVLIPGTGVGSRYYTLPTTLNFERPVSVTTLFSTTWQEVEFGIGAEEYNVQSSGDGSVAAVQGSPVQKWDWKAGDQLSIEVWPLPSIAGTLRFEGQRTLTDLKSAGAYSSALKLDLDDLLVVLYVAAEVLANEKQDDSKIKLAMAEQRLNRIRAVYPSRPSGPFVLGGSIDRQQRRNIPITLVAP